MATRRNDIVVLHDSVAGTTRPATVGWLRQTGAGVFAAEQTVLGRRRLQPDLRRQGARGRRSRRRRRPDALVATAFGMSLLVQNSGVLPSLGDGVGGRRATGVARRANVAVERRADGHARARRDERRRHDGAAADATGAIRSRPRSRTTAGRTAITVTPTAPLANGALRGPPRRARRHRRRDDARRGHDVPGRSRARRDRRRRRAALPAVGHACRPPRATLSFTSNEAGSAFWCSDNNTPYHLCTRPSTSPPRPAAHSFRVFARDAAGQRGRVARRSRRGRTGRRCTATGCSAARARSTTSATRRTRQRVDASAPSTSTRRRPGYGYWIVNSSGRVFAFGDRAYLLGGAALARRRATRSRASAAPRAATATGCSPDGAGSYAFGDAHFYGDLRNTRAQRRDRRLGPHPVRPAATTWSPSDGGVFSFGDAHFHGSTGAMQAQRAGPVARPRPRRRGLLAGRRRRWRVRLRRAVPRVDGRRPSQPADRRHGRRSATAT